MSLCASLHLARSFRDGTTDQVPTLINPEPWTIADERFDMSGLVSYGSSDENEDAVVRKASLPKVCALSISK